MRLLFTLSLFPVWLATGMAQTATNQDRPEMVADKLVRADDLLRGQGRVKAKLGACAIQADEGMLHSATGELELRGHVVVNLPAREDHYLFRFGFDTIVTVNPVIVHADRLEIKNGLMQAWGNIVIRPVDPESADVPQIHGDEVSRVWLL